MTLTREHIEAGVSINGGWSNAQFRVLGVKLPAKHGWKKALVGKLIDVEDYEEFIRLKDRHLKNKMPKVRHDKAVPLVPPLRIPTRTINPLAEMLNLTMHFDGSCWPNPGGKMGYGWHVDRSDGDRLGNGGGPVEGYAPEIATNNSAEFEGLIRGLEWLSQLAHPIDTLTIYGDSQLVVRQVNREWGIKKPHLKKLAERVWELMQVLDVGHLELSWKPREENSEADRLSKL